MSLEQSDEFVHTSTALRPEVELGAARSVVQGFRVLGFRV